MPKSWAQTLQTIKECRSQIFTSLIVSIGGFGTGTVFGWSAVAISTILPYDHEKGEFHESKKSFEDRLSIESWVASLAILGAFIGGPIGGALMDYIGRRYAILACSLPFLIGWMIMLTVYFTKPNGFFLFYVGRVLTGICGGSFLVIIPTYLKEISDDDIRGVLGSLMPLSLVSGILFSFVLGAYTNWFVLSWGCAVAPVALAVGILFIPETPRYLIVKNKIDKAILAFKKLSGIASDDDALAKLTMIFPDDFNKDPDKKPPKRGFLRRCVLCPITIMFLVMMFQQLSGVNALQFYTIQIFIQASCELDPRLLTVLLGVVNVIFVLVSAFVIELLGRKTLLVWMHLLMALSLSILGAFFYLIEKNDGSHEKILWLAPTVIYLYMAAYCCGPGSIPWVLGPEIFNPGYQGNSMSSSAESATIMTTSYWIFGFIVAKTFEDLSSKINLSGSFWFYAAFSFGGFIFSLLLVPETKGKSSEDIMAHFGSLHAETGVMNSDEIQNDARGGESIAGAPPSLSLNPSETMIGASATPVPPVTSDTKDVESPG